MTRRAPRVAVLIAAVALAVAAGAAAAARAPARPTVRLDVVYTSDVHGHLGRDPATFLNPELPPTMGGGASAAAYVRGVRRELDVAGGRLLVFDSGDWFTGTPLGDRTRGTAVIEFMNRLGVDASTIGNHDFDQGRDNAERLARLARFPVLAANLLDDSTGARVPWVHDVAWFEAGALKIAVLGYITEQTPRMAFARNVAGLRFAPVIERAPADVARVRAQGADLVFVLLHEGLPWAGDLQAAYRDLAVRDSAGTLRRPGMNAMELARAVPGVDAWFCGHTHQGYAHPWEDPVTHALVFEPYANGSSLGHVTFTLDPITRQIVGWRTWFDRGALLTLLEDEVWPDTAEARILGEETVTAEQGLEEVVGHTEVPLEPGTPESGLLGALVADAFREELGADAALQNTGGVRGRLRAGPITRRDLLQVSPFGNDLVLAQVPGAMLRDLLEDKLRGRAGGVFASGIRVRYDLSRPEGRRMVECTVAGAPLDTSRVYQVAMTNYLAEGNSGMERLRALPPEAFQPAGFVDLDVLTRYVARHDPLRPVDDGRWKRAARP